MAPYRSYGPDPRFKNIRVPDMLKCIDCDIVKPQAQFSKHLEELKELIWKNRPRYDKNLPALIRCNMHGLPIDEFACGYCDVTKARDKFAKAQLRANPDNPKCIKCQTNIQKQPPAGEYGDEDSNDGSSGGSDDLGSSAGSSTMAGTTTGMSSMSLNGSSSHPSSSTGGVPLSSSNGFNGRNATFTPRTNAARGYPSSVASSSRTNDTLSTRQTSGRGKFPRVGACTPGGVPNAARQERDRDVARNDDDDFDEITRAPSSGEED